MEDPAKPLSEKGILDIKKVASHLSSRDIKVDQIFHSDKLRAKQTAEVLAENLKPSKGLSEIFGLNPIDDPEKWVDILKDMTDDIMLVGHLPHLDKLSSLLLCGDINRKIVVFQQSEVACLKRDEDGKWSFEWMANPEVIEHT
jgi:phosphohistidine phosphatase